MEECKKQSQVARYDQLFDKLGRLSILEDRLKSRMEKERSDRRARNDMIIKSETREQQIRIKLQEIAEKKEQTQGWINIFTPDPNEPAIFNRHSNKKSRVERHIKKMEKLSYEAITLEKSLKNEKMERSMMQNDNIKSEQTELHYNTKLSKAVADKEAVIAELRALQESTDPIKISSCCYQGKVKEEEKMHKLPSIKSTTTKKSRRQLADGVVAHAVQATIVVGTSVGLGFSHGKPDPSEIALFKGGRHTAERAAKRAQDMNEVRLHRQKMQPFLATSGVVMATRRFQMHPFLKRPIRKESVDVTAERLIEHTSIHNPLKVADVVNITEATPSTSPLLSVVSKTSVPSLKLPSISKNDRLRD